MIFINSRPVDENGKYERRPSTVTSSKGKLDSSRMVLILILFYLLASVFPLVVYYPISIVSLIVPIIVLVYVICVMNGEVNHEVWPCCLIGVFGIMAKLGGLIVYLSIFTLRNEDKFEKRYKTEMPETNAKSVFFFVLLAVEVGILLVASCFKWHLIAFENDNKRTLKVPIVESA